MVPSTALSSQPIPSKRRRWILRDANSLLFVFPIVKGIYLQSLKAGVAKLPWRASVFSLKPGINCLANACGTVEACISGAEWLSLPPSLWIQAPSAAERRDESQVWVCRTALVVGSAKPQVCRQPCKAGRGALTILRVPGSSGLRVDFENDAVMQPGFSSHGENGNDFFFSICHWGSI